MKLLLNLCTHIVQRFLFELNGWYKVIDIDCLLHLSSLK